MQEYDHWIMWSALFVVLLCAGLEIDDARKCNSRARARNSRSRTRQKGDRNKYYHGIWTCREAVAVTGVRG